MTLPRYRWRVKAKGKMIALGSLKLTGVPKIVASARETFSLRRMKSACPFDIVELRIDLFSSFHIEHILSVAACFKSFPKIATIRLKAEGGGWRLSEEKRLSLFTQIIPLVDAIDIELSAKSILKEVVDTAHRKKKTVILSYHNFDKTPSLSALNRILEKGRLAGADIVKIAALAQDKRGLQLLAHFTLMNSEKNIITIAMGEVGTLSRIFFPVLGSLLTYAPLGQPTAPGQIDCCQLAKWIKTFYP